VLRKHIRDVVRFSGLFCHKFMFPPVFFTLYNLFQYIINFCCWWFLLSINNLFRYCNLFYFCWNSWWFLLSINM
jgi:hypothetical protein